MKIIERRRRHKVWRRRDPVPRPSKDRVRIRFGDGANRGAAPGSADTRPLHVGDDGGPNVRLRLLGAICVALALTVVARLWYLQVLDGRALAAQASSNVVRIARDEAPRGRVLAADGSVLVDNRVSLSVGVELTELTAPSVRKKVIARLSVLLGMPEADIQRRLQFPKGSPVDAIPIADDVPQTTLAYIREHQEDFPGVVPVLRPIRIYPVSKGCPAAASSAGQSTALNTNPAQPGIPGCDSVLAPHVLGYVGSADDAALAADPSLHLGDSLGRGGVEQVYDKALRGSPGLRKLEVNAAGRQLRTLGQQLPVQGNDVKLTIDPNVQRVAETSLAEGIATARATFDKNTNKNFTAPGGAVVVLDPSNGGVLGMASYPSFNPSAFTGGIPQPLWDQLRDPANQFPLNNRAIAGLYAPGSTFKVVTAVAGLVDGYVTPKTTINAGPFLQVGNRKFKDWKPGGHGPTDLRKSIVESVDVYYYTIGFNMYRAGQSGQLAAMARQLALGTKTGIDLPGEASGRIPDENWKRAVHNANPVAFPDPHWYAGDSVNMAIGQGDVLVTPLQLAVLYGAFANGGTLYKPHVAADVQTQTGRVLQDVPPQALAHLPITGSTLAVMQSGLQGVVSQGTAAAAFAGFPLSQFPIAGKTGTAQAGKRQDYALFVSYAPANNPKYVVAVAVEQAGHGGSVAAPVARRIYEQLFGLTSHGLASGAITD